MELQLRATGQCYLPPNTSEHTRLNPSQTGWYSIYQPRWDGKLTWPAKFQCHWQPENFSTKLGRRYHIYCKACIGCSWRHELNARSQHSCTPFLTQDTPAYLSDAISSTLPNSIGDKSTPLQPKQQMYTLRRAYFDIYVWPCWRLAHC